MFELSSESLEPFIRSGRPVPPSSGAVVTFEGRVRNHQAGQGVLRLEYTAYDDLALKEGGKVLEEALVRFPIEEVFCIHRVGRLEIGEAAVWIWVAAGHRTEAFQACSWIIDEIKTRVPLWKNEVYEDGSRAWPQ